MQNVSEDLSHSDTRLSVQLNGFELHTYNRSSLYKDLEEKFGLEPGIIPQEEVSDYIVNTLFPGTVFLASDQPSFLQSVQSFNKLVVYLLF